MQPKKVKEVIDKQTENANAKLSNILTAEREKTREYEIMASRIEQEKTALGNSLADYVDKTNKIKKQLESEVIALENRKKTALEPLTEIEHQLEEREHRIDIKERNLDFDANILDYKDTTLKAKSEEIKVREKKVFEEEKIINGIRTMIVEKEKRLTFDKKEFDKNTEKRISQLNVRETQLTLKEIDLARREEYVTGKLIATKEMNLQIDKKIKKLNSDRAAFEAALLDKQNDIIIKR